MSLLDLASLVLAPTATKEGKVYSAIPDTGEGDMTFTRGSSATRINSAGLIEKERGNLLLQSNSFDTTWANTGSTLTSGQSGYNGNNAWLLHTSSTPQRIEQNVSINGVSTFSVYGKAGTANYLRVQTQPAGTDVFFDVANGTIASQEAAAIDATITDVGNGWYRCSMSVNQNVTNVRILVQSAIYGVNVGDNIYIQDAQLEQGLVAQSYIETTTSAVYEGITDDVPRVDYSGGGCPSLLLEGSRTNVITQSEYFGDWSLSRTSAFGSGSILNDTTSPEGVINAAYIQQASGETTRGGVFNAYSYTSGTTYTLSAFAKKKEGRYLQLGFSIASGGGAVFCGFDLQEGVKGTPSSGVVAEIESLTDGWYRCSITKTSEITGVRNTFLYQGNSLNGSGATPLEGIYIYGAMLEAGSYSTSYIPTYSVSSTRVGDSCSKTGISELIGQTEGTIFAEIDSSQFLTGSYIGISDGGTTNRQIFGWEANSGDSGKLRLYGFWNGFAYSSFSKGEKIKIALAYKTNDFALYVNGTQAGTNTSASTSGTLSQFAFNSGSTSQKYQGNVYQAILFPTRLTNDQLEELTK